MVSACLMLLSMLSEYVHLTRVLPGLATEAVHRVAELLKLFNSRTCQLVLGAGAMQVSIQGTFGEDLGNFQGTFRELSGNFQGSFRDHPWNIQLLKLFNSRTC
jgi:hypothetical protein